MAVSPIELGYGPRPPVSETAVSLPPSPESQRVPLKISGNGIDLDIDLSKLDEHNRLSKGYEAECFNEIVSGLSPNEVAFGAHFLNSAFESLKQVHLSVPDAIVGELDYTSVALDPSGVPLDIDKPWVRLTKIIEARTAKINGNLKLAGFKNLTAEITRDPQRFTSAINSLLQERSGLLSLGLLFAPADREIDVIFYSPRFASQRDLEEAETDEEMRQRHLAENPFRKVEYKHLPLPVQSPALKVA